MSLTVVGTHAQAMQSCFRGINLAGAEFGALPGQYDKDYIYPSRQTIRYFASNGFTTVRLPFLWERLQPRLGSTLDRVELKRLSDTVAAIRATGMTVVLDPHNYARYNGALIGSESVSVESFADFWQRLASIFANQDGVIFGLMNEPYDISARDWLSGADAALAAIRKEGAANLVLVPGTAWTGAHSWIAGQYGEPNATVMIEVTDPADNFAYEFHQYFDEDFSGTKGTCARAAEAVAAVANVTEWLRANGKRGYLGEFGAPAGADCLAGLSAMVDAVETNSDVWHGWAYWAGGDWWPKDEELNIQPTPRGDKPQLAALRNALKSAPVTGPSCGQE